MLESFSVMMTKWKQATSTFVSEMMTSSQQILIGSCLLEVKLTSSCDWYRLVCRGYCISRQRRCCMLEFHTAVSVAESLPDQILKPTQKELRVNC